MKKQEAIDFIHTELDLSRSREEIAAELCRLTGAPKDLMDQFVAQEARQHTPRPAAPPAPPAFTTAAAAAPAAGKTATPEVSPELEQFIVGALMRNQKESDVIMAVCERASMDWNQAQRLIARVSYENRKKLSTRRNILVIPLGIGIMLAGSYLIFSSASRTLAIVNSLTGGIPLDPVYMASAGQSAYYAPGIFIAGLGMLLGGAIGLFWALRDQFS